MEMEKVAGSERQVISRSINTLVLGYRAAVAQTRCSPDPSRTDTRAPSCMTSALASLWSTPFIGISFIFDIAGMRPGGGNPPLTGMCEVLQQPKNGRFEGSKNGAPQNGGGTKCPRLDSN